MSFSENLKTTRKSKNLSQEQLAELLNVSRQAISKWEQDEGYPETEKLIQLARALDVSLDFLLLDKQPVSSANGGGTGAVRNYQTNGNIIIRSFDGKKISAYCDFDIIKNAFPSKKQPKCMLGGKKNNFWGGITELGWYATVEDAQRELDQIYLAIQNGEPTYQLKYYAKIKGRFNPTIIASP